MKIFNLNLDQYKFKNLSLSKIKTDKSITENIDKSKREILVKSSVKTYTLELQYLTESELQTIESKLQELELIGKPYIDINISNIETFIGTGIKTFMFDFNSYKPKLKNTLFELSIELKINIF